MAYQSPTLAEAGTEEDAEYAARLAAANIHPVSYLATDYLNHFNEIVMLMEMLPDMPDMIEDCLEWQPKSYQDHFRDSGFKDKELAIEAFDRVKFPFKAVFLGLTERLNVLITRTIKGIQLVAAGERGLSEEAQTLVRGRIAMAQAILMDLNSIIHGNVDNLKTISAEAEDKAAAQFEEEESAQTQEDIDKLFD